MPMWRIRAIALAMALSFPAILHAQPVAPAPRPAADKPEAKSPPFGAFKFRNLGPAVTSGRVVGLAVDPGDRAKYFAAVASGGLWKTVNAGTTWQPVFDDQGSYSIGYVTLDPKNPNVVWVGTGENNSQRSVAYGDGVYKSVDGGKTWRNVGLKASEHIGKIVIDPRNSDVVYVAAQGPLWGPGGDRGLYKTTNGGTTWEKVLSLDDNTGVTDVILDPTNPDVLTAASYQRRRHVWTLINGGPGSAIHRSTDGGKTWKKLGGGLPGGDLGRIGLAIAPTDPQTLYATIEAGDKAGGIFRSSDGGTTWEKRNPFDAQAQYYAHLTVDPTNKDRIYVMNVFIQVSDDGGRTLRALGDNSKHVDSHCLWVDPDHPDYYMVGCDGGIYETHDKAANWHFKSNLPVTQFYDIAVDQNPASGPFYHVYGGTQDNYTLGGPVRTRSQHGITNADWYVVQGGDGFHCKVDPTDSNTVYGEYQYGGLCRYDRRTGNRVDIQPQTGPGEPPLRWNWDAPLALSAHNPKRLYYAANKLFRSDDRGDSWTAISPDLTHQLNRDTLPVMGKVWGPDAVSKHVSTSFYGNCVAIAESPLKDGVIYVGTDDGLIQTTIDGGKTWIAAPAVAGVPERTYVSKLVASQHDAATLFAAFDNHKNADFKPYLAKSTDGGKSWASISGDLPDRGTVYCLAEDHINPKLLFCGTEFGLYVTQDGGSKWHRLKNGLPTIQVKDLVIQKANDDLVVGTFGRGIYVLDDYSPLRTLAVGIEKAAEILPVRDAVQYVRSAQYGGGGKAFLGASFYTAENPPHGATFTLRIKESPKTLKQKRKDAEKEAEKAGKPVPYPTPDALRAELEEEAVTNSLIITDRDGEIINRMTAPTGEGVHRLTWQLRENGVNPDAEQGGFGLLAVPGQYAVQLVQRAGGTITPLTDPVSFVVKSDPVANLSTDDYAAIRAFNKQVRAVQAQVQAAASTAGELATHLEAMKKALAVAPKTDAATEKKLDELTQQLKRIRRSLDGDGTLAARNENVPPSLRSLAREAASANQSAIAKPTGTQRTLADAVAKAIVVEATALRVITEQVLPPLRKALDAAGAPWTPGR